MDQLPSTLCSFITVLFSTVDLDPRLSGKSKHSEYLSKLIKSLPDFSPLAKAPTSCTVQHIVTGVAIPATNVIEREGLCERLAGLPL